MYRIRRASRPLVGGVLLAFLSSSAFAALPFFDSEGDKIPSLAPMLEKVNPAVVNISVFATRTVQNPLMNDPFFRRFFNIPQHAPQQQQQQRSQAAGSGVIVDADKGTVITNYHVIKGADEIKVSLTDGRILDAKLVGSDPDVDIAVLDVEAKNLTELKRADSAKIRVGDFVVAIGNPFGLGQTVTTGVVSALGRSGLGIEGYEDFIQTDASINPGNSGGALVDLKGELVGVNTAIIAPAGGNVGIGFAIPINMVMNSVSQILESGEVKRGQLGVVIQDLTPDLAEAFELKGKQGVVVAEVQKGSAAEEGGVEPGDVLIELDGKPLTSAGQLRNQVGLKKIGDKVKLKLLRDGDEKSLTVAIGAPSENTVASEGVHQFLEGATLAVSRDPAGVVVKTIEPGSAAEQSGLQEGDVIVSANKKRVETVEGLRKAVRDSDQVLLRVERGNLALYLVLR
ncbi:MAG TPA: DegQ family serine endoprotease [Dongiaceae bacterium]|nr:DegQ family serine endoprotease [Dongiaceae bacterium]